MIFGRERGSVVRGYIAYHLIEGGDGIFLKIILAVELPIFFALKYYIDSWGWREIQFFKWRWGIFLMVKCIIVVNFFIHNFLLNSDQEWKKMGGIKYDSNILRSAQTINCNNIALILTACHS